jgi:hypothetical protein
MILGGRQTALILTFFSFLPRISWYSLICLIRTGKGSYIPLACFVYCLLVPHPGARATRAWPVLCAHTDPSAGPKARHVLRKSRDLRISSFFTHTLDKSREKNLEVFGGHLAKSFCEFNLEIYCLTYTAIILEIFSLKKSRDFLSSKISSFFFFLICVSSWSSAQLKPRDY